jgi:hypothetical protein
MGDEQLYLTATNELEGGERNEAFWAKSMAQCEGDEQQARYKYISLRVEQLTIDPMVQREKPSPPPQPTYDVLHASVLKQEMPSPPENPSNSDDTVKPKYNRPHMQAAEFAKSHDITTDEVITMINNGQLEGEKRHNVWYVMNGAEPIEEIPSQLTGIEGLKADNGELSQVAMGSATPNRPHKLNDWLTYPVTPWRRYAARLLDTFLNGSIGGGLFALGFYSLAPYTADQLFENNSIAMDLIVWSVIVVGGSSILTGVMIGFTGSTIGKWIFGIRITDQYLYPIGIARGIARDFSVIIRGMAFGIPLISQLFMYHSYKELKQEGVCFWDRENSYVVSHRPNGAFQYALNTLGLLIIVILQALAQAAEQIF